MKTRIKVTEKGNGEVIYEAQIKDGFFGSWRDIYEHFPDAKEGTLQYAQNTIDARLARLSAQRSVKTSSIKYP